MATFRPFDVLVVPFPFADRKLSKRRPALVLSREEFNEATGSTLLAMITSAQNPPWLFDIQIDAASCGLPAASKVRFKLFTLDNRLIIRRVGSLAEPDRKHIIDMLPRVVALG